MKVKSKLSTDASEFISQFGLLKSTPEWLQKLQSDARATLLDVGFPTQKVENWKYTNTQKLLSEKFTFAESAQDIDIPLLENSYSLVFVDGLFAPELSNLAELPAGLEFKTLSSAIIDNDEAVKAEASTSSPDISDAFTQLNDAYLSEGAYISAARNTVCDKTLHIINVGVADKSAAMPRNIIVVESGAEISVLEDYITIGENCVFTNAVSDIRLAKNGTLNHIKNQSQNLSSYHVSKINVKQERDSNYNSSIFACGSAVSRCDTNTDLNDENASVVLNGLYAARESQLCDNHTIINHNAAHTYSQQLYKGILDGRSRGVFNGKVFIARDSQKVDSSQMNKNLMLSDKARVDTKPELDVYADDVKAAHGATIGQLNDEELFYIQSRCISKETALAMLVHGYMDEIIGSLKHEEVQSYLQSTYLALFD